MSSWGFGNVSTGRGGGSEQAGPEIEQIDTPQLMFADEAVASGDRLKLFSQPWPADSPPRPGASLLAIASQKKLLAAAGPDGLILTGTAALRSQYIPRRRKKDESRGILENEPSLKPYTPEITLQVPRLSHVAFSSDESCLVIVAEQGGGLACYDVNALTNGTKEPAFQIGTMGQAVRQLLVNPNPDAKFTGFVGIVLESGQLLLADLLGKKLVKGANGNDVFHENVQCASWSKLGKQIVAGLQDSTSVQIDFNAQVKDRIPQPPQLIAYKENGNDGFYAPNLAWPVSTIYWLETHKFLIIYSPQANQPEDPMPNHSSLYFIAQREKGQPFTFRQFQDDPCMAAMEPKRLPAAHYIQRLSEWGPALQDLLIMTSSATADIGTIASFKDQNGEFVVANLDENRKAGLPMSYVDGAEDTTAVGMAIDFSAVECAPRPIPDESDTIEDAPFPLPALCILNTDGVLQMWWTVYAPSVKQTEAGGPFMYSGIVNKEPPHITYTHYSSQLEEDTSSVSNMNSSRHLNDAQNSNAAAIQAKEQGDGLLAAQSPFGAAVSKPTSASTILPGATSAFGGGASAAFGGTSQLGQKASPWGGASATPTSSTFGQSTFGQASTPASIFGAKPAAPTNSLFGTPSVEPGKSATTFGAPSAPAGQSPFGTQTPTSTSTSTVFGRPSAVGESPAPTAFGKPSTVVSSPAPTTFGQTSAIGTGSGFGQVGLGGPKASIWGAPSATAPKTGADSPFAPKKTGVESSGFAGFAKQPSPFAAAANQSPGLFGSGGSTNGESAFSAVGKGEQLGGFGKASTPALNNENSMGSTATIGSTPFSSFGKIGSGSSALSREATGGSGTGSAFAGFKLGSGFTGDGSAKDDLPKPKNLGGGLFGGDFMSGAESEKPNASSSVVKPEPGTEKEPSLKDIPEAPSQKEKFVAEDAPLPPDPSNYKMPDDAPLPPDFTTTKTKVPDDMPLPPDFAQTKKVKNEVSDDDVPIAGSPPINVTNSQTFSSEGPSVGPSDDGSGFEDEDDEDNEDDVDEEDDEDDEGGEEDSSEAGSEDSWVPDEATAAKQNSFAESVKNRVTPPARTVENPTGLAREASYTPAGLPKGPTFPPPQNRPILSPRSPSPHRAVTSPVARSSTFKPLPQQIKTTSIPPAKPVERPAPASPKPQEPTAGELEDQAADRVKDTLSQPPVPSKELPAFYTHQDYAGTVDKSGVGGQIETVYRDVNSMIDVLGLNARSLEEFLEGHIQLRKPGARTPEDLDDIDGWCLGDVEDIARISDSISTQLQDGQLERVPTLLAGLDEQQRAILQLKSKTMEMRKLLTSRTDPEKVAQAASAPLSAEMQAQQSELRQGVQVVQSLLTEVENKLALLRADLVAAQSGREGQKGPVPTVEAVTKTIQKMTAMVEGRSGDIDLLESQIKRLPLGIASLRLGDEYEDDLVSALGGSKLLTGSPSRSTPRRARMAANGDALGMSGMFDLRSSSRLQTPPNGNLRRSLVAFTPGSCQLGRSTGSARKKAMDVTEEEVEIWLARRGRRRTVLGELRRGLESKG